MTVFITGGASGIGLAAAEHFSAKGMKSVLFDVNAEGLGRAVDAVSAKGGRSRSYLLDVSDGDQVISAFARAHAEVGAPSILINAAGIGARAPALDLALADWHRVMGVNVTGSFLCARAAARQMIDANVPGRIINFASSLAIRAGAGRVAYGTSKTAVIGLTRQLAVEWITHGITVNAIAPGWIETSMTAKLTGPLREAYRERTPATRFGEVADIVAAVSYVASPEAQFLNGHILVVDGGFTVFGLPDV